MTSAMGFSTLPSRMAWRYLRSKKSHSAVGAISMTSICGMAVATAAIICVLSVFNGFQSVIAGRLDTLSPDVLVTPAKGKTIADGEGTAKRVLAVDGVQLATPTISDNALALCDGREMPVLLKGVDPETYAGVTSVKSLIIPDNSGRFLTNGASGPEGTVSIGVASQLGAFPGDRFLIFAPRREGRVNLANPLASFITDSITVSGVFRTDQSDYDTDRLIVDLATARRLFSYDSQASAIEVKARKGTEAAVLAERIAAELGPEYVVKDRMRQQEMNFRMIQIEKWVSFLLLFFILIIASFNIISSLSMLVLEKQSSLSILSAMGMNRHRIGEVFSWESIFVSLAGGVSGIALGIILVLLQERFGLIKIAGGGALTAYPVVLEWSDVGITFIPVIAIGIVTAFITAAFARSRIK